MLENSLPGWFRKGVRLREGALPGKFRLRQALAGSLFLLAMVASLPPHSPAQESGLLQASASGEYSVALPELPESLRVEWVQQERLLRDSFEQQVLDIREDNRASLRKLREDAAEARLQAREEYREELRELREEHNEEMQRLSADLPPEKYQRKREDLQEEYLDDIEDLRADQERLIDEIGGDLEEELDELTAELEQLLFDLRTEKQYALEQLKAEKMEALLQHYRRQLDMEALRMIMSSLGVGPLGEQVVFEILDYLRDRVYIEASHTDLGPSRIRMTVTVSVDPVVIDQAMELFDLSGVRKMPDEGPPPGRERVPSNEPSSNGF
ncbi:hypothetical protein N9903_01735 [bacterium]|nr:hypothetical protein [bacterium]